MQLNNVEFCLTLSLSTYSSCAEAKASEYAASPDGAAISLCILDTCMTCMSVFTEFYKVRPQQRSKGELPQTLFQKAMEEGGSDLVASGTYHGIFMVNGMYWNILKYMRIKLYVLSI